MVLFNKAKLKTEVRITLKGRGQVIILHGDVKNIHINWSLHLCSHHRCLNIKREAELYCSGLGQ